MNSRKDSLSTPSQEHKIELENLERVFRNSFDRENAKVKDTTMEANSNCSDDEEYTPKKQRMSKFKQEPYKCEVNGCGKIYRYISHYRHHQDSHKLVTSAINVISKSPKPKQGKPNTVSFYQ